MTIDSFLGEYFFLSNFYPYRPFHWDGVTVPTSEHAYMMEKTSSPEEKALILATKTPGQAKRVGAKVTLIPNWDELRISAMHGVLLAKFSQNLDLKERLLDTGDQYLVEGNTWHDNFWGSCMCPRHNQRSGRNQLGNTLMLIRGEFRDGT